MRSGANDHKITRTFLSIVREGIGHEACLSLKDFDWTKLKSLADKQGLTTIVLDGLDRVQVSMPQMMRLE